jgi:hypothetical protein
VYHHYNVEKTLNSAEITPYEDLHYPIEMIEYVLSDKFGFIRRLGCLNRTVNTDYTDYTINSFFQVKMYTFRYTSSKTLIVVTIYSCEGQIYLLPID